MDPPGRRKVSLSASIEYSEISFIPYDSRASKAALFIHGCMAFDQVLGPPTT